MTKLLIIFTLFFSSMAMAENTPFLNLLGYSNSGKYMAFQEAVVADGSGAYYSTIRVLDTVQDKYVGSSKAEIQDTESGSNVPTFAAFVSKAQKDAGKLLKDFGINKSKGQQLIVSTAPRLSALTYKNKYITMWKMEKSVVVDQARYEECKLYGLDMPGEENTLLGYQIEASDADNYTGGVTLHSDSRIPKSRGCPQAYSINSAVAFGDQVTLFVSVQTFGFEGPDIAFITVPFNINDIK